MTAHATTRVRRLRAAAVVAVLACATALAGCAGDAEQSVASAGPNGYTLVASNDDGTLLWWDRSPESSLTDLILEDPEGRYIASCLGTGPQMCIAGPDTAKGVLVIAPEGATRAVVDWFGQPVELTQGTGIPAEAPPVFVGLMPPVGAEGTPSVQVFDGSGAVLWQQ